MNASKSIFQLFCGSIGTLISFFAFKISTTELSEIISIITGILGVLIVVVTNLVIPLIRWWLKAKKDGKIDDEEIKELTDVVENGIDKVNSKKGDKDGR